MVPDFLIARLLGPFTCVSLPLTYPLSTSFLQCTMEGLSVAFQTQPQFSANPGQRNEVYAQVRNYRPSLLTTACKMYPVIACELSVY